MDYFEWKVTQIKNHLPKLEPKKIEVLLKNSFSTNFKRKY